MAIELINPDALPKIPVYHQVAVAKGTRMVFVTGQVSWDANGDNLAVGDLAGQVERCYLNVAEALAAAGGSVADLAKLTAYVVGYTPDKLEVFLEGVQRAEAALGMRIQPPSSLIGVAALDIPEHLVELEAVAVLD
ncbi:enamine deaminase RidA (YjgF/YER057c/UK114 family) [Crossiella equi]|uniref:Enamine deaminase RidA (YjgF/YER057c/UK114 family) n=1 Tax=Crossiella equi TaxID=130796 RepID=A0ABS5AE93_9PSEU|nr:RidA family protein [Crossiella equi]MBP2474911.1 enamine deaminase RidA (YjgF/YER057c/UK114 family) [Crossiella equi]